MKPLAGQAENLPSGADGGLPTILVVFGKSWGSIDWILPVLWAVKEKGLGRVCAYFHQEVVLRRSDRYADLSQIFHGVAEEMHTPGSLVAQLPLAAKFRLLVQNCLEDIRVKRRPIRAALCLMLQLAVLPFRRRVYRAHKVADHLLVSLLQNRLQGRRVEYLLQDLDYLDYRAFYEAFAGAEVVVFPHGTNWIDDHDYSEVKIRRMREVPEHAIWLTGRERDAQFLRKKGLRATITACGHPKYDPDWIAKIGGKADRSSASRRRDDSRLTMLLLTRPRKKLADKNEYRRLIRAIFRVAARHDLRVTVKLHPSQRPREVTAQLDSRDRRRIEWCNTSVLSAAAAADFVVALPTSAVMDAVAMGTPVLEFFDYTRDRHTTYVRADGETTSMYRQQKLVVPVDTEAELDSIVDRIKKSPEYLDDIVAVQQSVLARLLTQQQGVIASILSQLQLSGEPKRLHGHLPHAFSSQPVARQE